MILSEKLGLKVHILKGKSEPVKDVLFPFQPLLILHIGEEKKSIFTMNIREFDMFLPKYIFSRTFSEFFYKRLPMNIFLRFIFNLSCELLEKEMLCFSRKRPL